MSALAIIVTHQNVPVGPVLAEDQLAASMLAGTANLPGYSPGVRALIASIFVENRAELILRAAAEIQADLATVNLLYQEGVANHEHRIPGWELAMATFLPTGDPSPLKNAIHADWLELDPEELAKAVPVSFKGYVSTYHIAEHSLYEAPGLVEAFAAWYGVRTHGTGGIYAVDWQQFLADLRHARAIAIDPDFDMPENGIVYRSTV